MATLTELARFHTALDGRGVNHLQRLVAGIADREEHGPHMLALEFHHLAHAEGLGEGREAFEDVGEMIAALWPRRFRSVTFRRTTPAFRFFHRRRR